MRLQTADRRPLRIALFQADVTPPMGSPLCHGNVPCAQEIADPLSARGIVFFTDEDPIVVCAVDWVRLSNGGYDAWVEELAKAVGTPASRVSVHAVHQHDAPGIDFSVEELLVEHGQSGGMFNVTAARHALARCAEAAAEAAKKPKLVTHLSFGITGRFD